MNIETNKPKKSNIFDKLTKVGLYIILVVFFAYLLLGEDFMGAETNLDKSDYKRFSNGWMFANGDGSTQIIDFPMHLAAMPDENVTVSKRLEDEDYNAKWIMIWNKGQNVSIEVDGEPRFNYGRDTIKAIGRDIPYLYLFVPLYTEDAGKILSITYHTDNAKDAGFLGEVWIGDKTSLILTVVSHYQLEVVLAFILIFLGICSIGGSYVLYHYKKSKDPLKYLGLGVVLAGCWIVLNTQIRQFVFPNVSIVRNCAFLCVSIVSIPFMFYLDRIQERRFHKGYVILELCGFCNFLVTFVLNLTGVKGLSEMFTGTFFMVMIPIAFGIITLIVDVKNNKTGRYHLVAIGLVFFAIGTVAQMILYLTARNGIINASVMIMGMIAMLACSTTHAMKTFGSVYEDGKIAAQTAENLKISAMTTLVKTVDAKDKYTKGHSDRVAIYSKEIAKRMGLSKKEQKDIYYVGLLHDVGKLGIPDEIINKPGKLTAEEYDVIKSHPVIGSEILEDIKDVANITLGARWHHERFDGKGYPDGLKGMQIPVIARIIGVADAYDAMTSNRSYRGAMDQAYVRSEMVKNKGFQFDPEIADIMIKMIDEDKDYDMREKDIEEVSDF